jgi:diguanylate cyclase (GGDEF)-like protein
MARFEYMNATRLTFGPGVRRPLRGLAPFAAITLLAWIAVLVGESIDWPLYGVSVALVLASLLFGIAMALRDQLTYGTVIGALGYLAAVGLLRTAAGGYTTGVTILSLLPVFQTALYLRSRRSLAMVLVATGGMYLIPLVVVGPPDYPATGYRSALLSFSISVVIGAVTQELVADVRRRASEARQRARMLVAVNGAVRRLYDSASVRNDVCETVKEISDGVAVVLYEPDRATGLLTCTATTTAEPEKILGAAAAQGSAPYQAFAEGHEVLVTELLESRLSNIEVWRAAGSPETVLYQPLMRGEERLGVLVVGWRGDVDPESPRFVVAALLAHEAALVIGRVDAIEQLADDARTDPLTGLPNRRAWEARLPLAGLDRYPQFVAMFDIDRFKKYNDTHGHPAGDELLRQAAINWRAAMRSTDFFARIGGEEFAMLILGDDLETASAVVERLRAVMPFGQTCSVGIALRGPGESLEQLVGRADQALYRAKADGRDRSYVALPDRAQSTPATPDTSVTHPAAQ